MSIAIWDMHRTSIRWMGHPITKRAMYFIATKRGEPILRLNGFSSVIECQRFLQVSLYNTETGIDGRIAIAVREKTEVGEAWVGVVGVIGLYVTGTTDCIQHRL